MTNEELKELCAKKVMGYIGVLLEDEEIIELANEIRAIQLPEQEPVAALEKQIAELKESLLYTVKMMPQYVVTDEMKLARERAK